jgi:cysteine desulfurase/selenocysteine lyase
MSTSDRIPEAPGTIGPGADPHGSLTEQIARLANEMFAALPGGGLTPPPAPGFVQQPPLASAPFPKESDLRTLPATVSDGALFALPLGLVDQGSDPTAAAPYFLALAGTPSAATPPAISSPAPAGGAFPGGTPLLAPPGAGAFAGETSALAPPAGGASAGEAPLPTAPPSGTDRLFPTLELQPATDPAVARPFETRLFDPYSIRRDFPILQERIHGRPLVWLDNAATTQKPRAVIDRISYFYEHENSNVHRAAHTLAARATDAYEGAREKVRRFLNAPSAKDIVLARGATEAINLVAQSWGRRNVGPGDEIVISWLEHHANIVPWQLLVAEKGARLRVAPVDDRGQVILDEYEKLLGPRTRLVSISQVSNALGTIVPVREMIEMAHRHGARILIDGAQAVSHLPVDVQALDCDFYCFSGHKVFAPTGIGVLYGKSDVLAAMPPWQGGGNMIADVTFEKTIYQPPPGRFEAGTGSIADAVGLGAALDYVSAIGLPNIGRYEHELLEYATGCLATVPGLRLIGTAPEKAGVLSFVLDGMRTEEVGGALDQEGIAVRSGHHCAQPVLRRFGLESTVRASLAPYNTRDDIDALVAALRRLQMGRAPRPS